MPQHMDEQKEKLKLAIFGAHKFEKPFLEKAAAGKYDLLWLEPRLSETTAQLATGCAAVCIFVNDDASAPVLQKLKNLGITILLLRCAGYNNVDLEAAKSLGIRVARVPEYSPYAVAEHTVALMLALNRKLVKAHNRVRDGNFSLDGLTGFDMHGKTVGIIGLGKIGKVLAKIMDGFGCTILVHDPFPDQEFAKKIPIQYTDIDTLCRSSDIISLHAPLTEETKYLINKDSIATMKKGVMLINSGRGALINTKDVIAGLKSGQIGYLGMDVYEEEKALFFEDHSTEILQDDTIARLLTFSNVLITSHQAFLTDTALSNIAAVTINNLEELERNAACKNELTHYQR